MNPILRVLSIQLLHRGDRTAKSIIVWFASFACALAGAFAASGLIQALLGGLAGGLFVNLLLYMSAKWQRTRGQRQLAQSKCPKCGIHVGMQSASAAFAEYTRSCTEFIRQSKGAFSIDLASPLHFTCPCCSAPLFYDYVDSRVVSMVDDEAEPAATTNVVCVHDKDRSK